MHYSLSGRIIFLFLVGMVEAVMLFCVLHALSEDMLDEYFITSDYIYRSEQPYITLLQRFINENGVSSGDSEKLDAWIKWARHCRLPKFVELQKKINRHRKSILNTIKYHLSNARVEAINNKIKLSIRMAYGFRNIDNMLAMIMLRCSGIDVRLPWN